MSPADASRKSLCCRTDFWLTDSLKHNLTLTNCLHFRDNDGMIGYYDNTLKKEVPFYILAKRERAAAENTLAGRKGEVPFGVARLNFSVGCDGRHRYRLSS